MKKAIICDIDQCLLNSEIPIALTNRALSLSNISKEDAYNTFYRNLYLCTKNDWCYELIEQMSLDNDITILFITGRDEKCRKETESFLDFKYPVTYRLLMRPKGSLDTDAVVKDKLLRQIKDDYNILFAIDDKEENCIIYKNYGITTLKVN